MLTKSLQQDSESSPKTPYQVNKKSPGSGSCIGHRNKGHKQKHKDLLHGVWYSWCGWQLADQMAEGKSQLGWWAFKGPYLHVTRLLHTAGPPGREQQYRCGLCAGGGS